MRLRIFMAAVIAVFISLAAFSATTHAATSQTLDHQVATTGVADTTSIGLPVVSNLTDDQCEVHDRDRDGDRCPRGNGNFCPDRNHNGICDNANNFCWWCFNNNGGGYANNNLLCQTWGGVYCNPGFGVGYNGQCAAVYCNNGFAGYSTFPNFVQASWQNCPIYGWVWNGYTYNWIVSNYVQKFAVSC